MICLDSNFIIDILRNKHRAKQKLEEINKSLAATTIINLYELMSGVYAAKDRNPEKHINILNEFLADIQILQLDSSSVEKSSKINGLLSSKGEIIDDLDIVIAGICLSNGCNTILTENIEHFKRIKELKVESY